ncbi:hypothetical protein TI39_contig846g00002 [Zymoseptoria brevis]|uniref:Uncharacterized protein n=1 Tax=Zymoseptoria brevis TaxID=1047168 RepID=A0A0F4GF33_9PEZI|nr:hypothetical protein TI39_contig846g00002 [Zymoseptoria brevis]
MTSKYTQSAFRGKSDKLEEHELPPAEDVSAEQQKQEEKEHAALLANGAKNAQNVPEKQLVELPIRVAQISQDIGSLLREFWTRGHVRELEDAIETKTEDIRKINRENGRKPDDFVVDARKVLSQLADLSRCINDWWAYEFKKEATLADPKLLKKQQDSAMGAAFQCLNIMTTLDRSGISWKSFTPHKHARQIARVIQASVPNLGDGLAKGLMHYINKDYNLPSSFQASLMKNVEQPLLKVFAQAAAGNFDDAYRQSMDHIVKVNSKLEECNQAAGFRRDDHILPISDLKRLLSSVQKASGPEVKAKTEKGQLDFATFLYCIGYRQMALSFATQADIDKSKSELDGDKLRSILESQEIPDERDNEELRAELARQAAQENSPGSTPTDSTRSHATSPDSVNQNSPQTQSFPPGLRSSSIGGPIFGSDGVTHVGKVVSVQKVGMGYRCIVNIGTLDTPIYKFIAGGELGRGTASELALKFPHSGMDVRGQKAAHIEKLLAIVQADSISNLRAPITKFLVKWRPEAAIPKLVWITRSDLMGICGKSWTETRRQKLLTIWRRNLSHLDQMREAGLHPVTGKPLTEDIRNTMP